MPFEQFALAILLVDGYYLLQLRDDRPDVVAGGNWGLFGGRVEPQENATEAVAREVLEELNVRPAAWRFLWQIDTVCAGLVSAHWFFETDFTGCWGRHELREGQAAERFAFEEIAALRVPLIIRDALTRHHEERVSGS